MLTRQLVELSMGIRGDRLRERRQARGWSQPELARELSIVAGKTISQQSVALAEGREDQAGHAAKVSNPAFSVYLPTVLKTSLEYLTGKTSDPSARDLDMIPSYAPSGGTDPKPVREGRMELGGLLNIIGDLSRRLTDVERDLKNAKAPAERRSRPSKGRRTTS